MIPMKADCPTIPRMVMVLDEAVDVVATEVVMAEDVAQWAQWLRDQHGGRWQHHSH